MMSCVVCCDVKARTHLVQCFTKHFPKEMKEIKMSKSSYSSELAIVLFDVGHKTFDVGTFKESKTK